MSSYDLAAEISQDLVTKVINDSIPPAYTVIDKRSPFPTLAVVDTRNSDLPALITWAKSKSGSRKKGEEQFADELLYSVADAESDFNFVIAAKKEFDNIRDGKKPTWDGPSDKELSNYLEFGFDTKAHLAWVKVWIPSRPTITVSVPTTTIKGLKVSAGATGELWVRRPKLKCTKKWKGICYKWKKVWVWEKWASITLDSVTVAADVSIAWSVSGVKLIGSAKFDKLRLNYKILDKIPIENWVDPKSFTAMDAKELVGVIPILESKYIVSSIGMPKGSGLRLELTFKKN